MLETPLAKQSNRAQNSTSYANIPHESIQPATAHMLSQHRPMLIRWLTCWAGQQFHPYVVIKTYGEFNLLVVITKGANCSRKLSLRKQYDDYELHQSYKLKITFILFFDQVAGHCVDMKKRGSDDRVMARLKYIYFFLNW